MPDRGDEALVRAAQAGDRGAFGRLIERYQKQVYNVALRVSGNPDDALDATQEAFLAAWENLARFDPDRRFFSWIYRIGLNEILTIVARRRRAGPMPPDPPTDERPDPERWVEGREVADEVQRALGDLEPHQRTVIVLRHFQGLSYRDMSEVIGVRVETVKSRLFTARRMLRRRLEARGMASRRGRPRQG